MSDCTNVIINTQDILEKRKGFIRAFDERFGGVLCGIFKYTDEYGREKMIIAADGFWYIRSPYSVPTFTQSDAYPFDSFPDGDVAASEVNTDKWRDNVDRYQVFDDSLVLRTTSALGAEHADLSALAMRWFKEQSSRSYKVRIQYTFPDATVNTSVFIVIKGQEDLSGNAILMVVLDRLEDETLKMSLYERDAQGVMSLVGNAVSLGTTGYLQLEYNQQSRIAKATITPVGSALKSVSSEQFSELRDLDWGQNCGIGIAKKGTGDAPMIEVVDGGPV